MSFAGVGSPSVAAFVDAHPALRLLETRCASMADFRKLHAQLVKTGLARDVIATSRAVAFCAGAAGDVGYAMQLFSSFDSPNAFMWNAVIRAHSRSSSPAMAVSLFLAMLELGDPSPERHTFPPVFASFARLGASFVGAQLHGIAIKAGIDGDQHVRNAALAMYAATGELEFAARLHNPYSDVVADNAMITGLAKAGRVADARNLFDGMPLRTDVTWSAMVGAYTSNAMYSDAMALFREMQMHGVRANANALVSLLGACAAAGALEQGVYLHAYMERNGIPANALVTTVVIGMYCKCGCVDKAAQVFEQSKKKSLSMWNAMILGHSVHGRWKDAVELFDRMPAADGVTFLAMLTACVHAGRPDDAKRLVAVMQEDYAVSPELEHYGCLVDALARAGRLEEAEAVIATMPMAPDAAVWGALLAGCRQHGNSVVGERAARGLVAADPGDSGAYVTLSNTLASGGEFAGAAGAREMMEAGGVRKPAGCSFVAVNGAAVKFVAG